ncbi:3-deoxy-D-manno-octulosonate cytidylyltransferase [Ameyamaea chiangmaiensis NBRC 103196]|uniref:3-deoxy-manno-octulosonate cytidylyltransferase n=1 Tax=Ameyamaea chiangmaiensis TaxID=442969 RepID=A0A850P8P7_9PROT|nr:3-deoxy-manno-octulosonate cytidylyltransferase [Ameyamaea chiangmaiensis]MBS4073673.1 3-deoxy-manno-octulosonate cytidylyltransferase [Ameyamaea chiangmaiensis]NVN39059.1 3-deoxy-manno-octulosonate cytidylyltransferase [Ameyamaea chiangmaiensis]GBQ68855.1 3-deoxy-D-manno-octulosonate cytidylyltransferase [Ameyamaea chiangmaiensis NBRC 103196]
MPPLIIIPARMASTRLPGKPLADIAGRPMIVHVADRARAAALGEVVVAAAEPEIAAAVEAAGVRVVLTDPALPSGSDRVHAAAEAVDPHGRHTVIINLQGDLPVFDPSDLRQALVALDGSDADVGTIAAPIRDADEAASPSVVKIACALQPEDIGTDRAVRALYFSRSSIPANTGPLWHHVGVYAWRRSALRRFVTLPPSTLERRESLEQLRALEDGMSVGCAAIANAPFGVDTPADLERARRALAAS